MRLLTISLCIVVLSADGVCAIPVSNQAGLNSATSGGQTSEERIRDNLLAEASRPFGESSTIKKSMTPPEVSRSVLASELAASSGQPETHVFLKVPGEAQLVDAPPNTAVIVQGDSSLRLFDQSEIEHPSFDPAGFLSSTALEQFRPIEITPVPGQPYFVFMPPTELKPEEQLPFDGPYPARQRIKRHHPNTLHNVLGELQNYALVPIRSTNGKIRYILLKNPKFVIGSLPPGSSGQNHGPAIVQLGSAPPSRPVLRSQTPEASIVRSNLPVPVASPIDTMFNDGSSSAQAVAMTDVSSSLQAASSHPSASHLAAAHNHGGHTVQKTEVVETVVETKKQGASATAQEATAASSASQSTGTSNGDLSSGGQVGEVAAAASEVAASSAVSSAKQESSVKTVKKTTTTVVQAASPDVNGAASGGVQKITQQVVEEAVHENKGAAVETAAAASSASAVAAASSGTGVDSTSGVITDAAAAASSAASTNATASETNSTSSVKTKTIKTTVITKSAPGVNTAVLSDVPLASQAAAVESPSVLSMPAEPNAADSAILAASDMAANVVSEAAKVSRNPSKTPTAILSNNEAKLTAIEKPAVLFATERPNLVAPVIKEKTTTPSQATTEEKEFEGMDVSTTVATVPNPQVSPRLPQGAVGWAGPSTESAIGPLDRVNTTDVPEEIEPRPYKMFGPSYRSFHMGVKATAYFKLPDVQFGDFVLFRRKRALRPWHVYFPKLVTPVRAAASRPAQAAPARASPSKGGKQVAGWAGGPTTIEPALGSHDRVNTTDLPEEIEAAPDKTAAERRRDYLLQNPSLTEAEIARMERKMFAERARAAANQLEPVILAPPEIATLPPGASRPPRKPKPAAKPAAAKPTAAASKPKPAPGGAKLQARRNKPGQNTKKPTTIKPKPTIPTATPPTVFTTQGTYPTTEYYPTTQQTNWRPRPRAGNLGSQNNRPFKGNQNQKAPQSGPAQFGPSPQHPQNSNQGPGQNGNNPSFNQQGFGHGPPQQQNWKQGAQPGQWAPNNNNMSGEANLPPTTPYVTEPYLATEPYRPPPRQQQGPRRGPNRNQGPPMRQRRRRQRVNADGEEVPPYLTRDPVSRWILNNMDGGEMMDLLSIWAIG